MRPSFVAGVWGTKPKTRAPVTGRTWAYQTKSAFSDAPLLAVAGPGANAIVVVIMV
jgi:hypothetical protein